MTAFKSPSILETPSEIFTDEIMPGICTPYHLVDRNRRKGIHGRRWPVLMLGHEYCLKIALTKALF